MADVSTVLVKDSVIADITPDLTFAVKSGASSKTFQTFNATSSSNSNLVFNVTVPSENIIIDREVLINTGLSFTLRIDGCPAGDIAFDYGLLDALQAFPLASIMTTLNAQINNTSVSINLQDVLPQLVAMTSKRELQHWNGMTPCLRDQTFASYYTAQGTNCNPLGEMSNASYDEQLLPRGAHPVACELFQFNAANAFISTNPTCATLGNYFLVCIQTIVCEPLFLSPFIFAHPEYNAQGLLGVNNMVLQANIGNLNRLFSATPYSKTNVTPLAYTITAGIADAVAGHGTFVPNPLLFQVADATLLAKTSAGSTPALLFNFLSTQPSDVIETRNSVPYMDFPRYLTPSFNTPAFAQGATNTLNSSAIQLSQIPDLFIICVRKPVALMTPADANVFFKINSISLNLNNQSGLLSSSTPYDLWRMSVKNGSTQSWSEFSGQCLIKNTAVNGDDTGTGRLAYTTGSLLIINPAFDLSLPDYLSCGSIGNYNFQFNINVTNTSGRIAEAIQPEIVTITANSGVFLTQQGQSQVFTGLATKEMVLSAKSQKEPVSSVQYLRMVGGKMLNNLGLGMSMRGRADRIVGGAMSGGKMRGKLGALC